PAAGGGVRGSPSLPPPAHRRRRNKKGAKPRLIGYGAMLMESFVAIMALIAASIIEPGSYFAMNSPPAVIGSTAAEAAQKISSWGFAITPDALTQLAHDVGEKTVLSRTGGAPTLAVGMAPILSHPFRRCRP